jgi:hypothetical protein
MPLSITKLEKMLMLKSFIPVKYFTMNKTCVYIEVMYAQQAETFLLYIPSKYSFEINSGTRDIHKIKYVEMSGEENTADNYAGADDDSAIERKYDEVDLGLIAGDDIEPQLEEKYKKDITLKDISTGDSKEIKEIVRQLKRLKYCVQNVKYKIAIIYKNFICAIKRDDTIECYSIKKYNAKSIKKLYITVDLELFYEKMDSLMLNIESVRAGICQVLDKNHLTHTKTLHLLMEDRDDIFRFSESVYAKKLEYEKYLANTTKMLNDISESEKVKIEKIYEINESYKSGHSNTGNVERSHTLSKLESELVDIQRIKEDLVKTIFELKSKRDNTLLSVDKILFDNNIMIDAIIKNFVELGKIA